MSMKIVDVRPWKERKTEYFVKYNSVIINCECGKNISKGKMKRHLDSNYHKKRIQ